MLGCFCARVIRDGLSKIQSVLGRSFILTMNSYIFLFYIFKFLARPKQLH